jgi:hypothetical protein
VDEFFQGRAAPGFLGLSLEEARALCAERGYEGPREIHEGQNTFLTADRRPNRLNLRIARGRVTQAALF